MHGGVYVSAHDPATDRELLLQMNEKLDRLMDCNNDHEARLREVEHSFWKIIGLASFISFVTGFVGSKLNGG